MSNTNYVQVHTFQNKTYQEIWDFQRVLMQKLIQNKRFNTKQEKSYPQVHHLIFCEHNPVYTLGKSGKMDHLLLDKYSLAKKEIEFHKINRGGDITYHGPGQWTVYPILDMECFYRDIHKYIRSIETIVINVLSNFGIAAQAIDEYTGVWIKDQKSERKICAIGVHMSRWVSMHGFALNINTNLDYFNSIIPCGIQEQLKSVTSLSNELNKVQSMNSLRTLIEEEICQTFNLTVIEG